jgi:ubiquinone/menaquinone biosynthesis C-methylase UbiE
MTLARLLAQQLGNPSGITSVLAAALWNRRNARLNDVTFDSLALRANDRVLEVGFGGGYLLGLMSTAVTSGLLVGVDVSPAMVASCERRYRSLIREGRLELRCAPAESLPYPAEYFNKACSVNSVFYWADVQGGLSELARVLTGDGCLVLCFTCKESLEDRRFAEHVRLYEEDEIQQMAVSCGFQVITKPLSDKHREFLRMIARKRS